MRVLDKILNKPKGNLIVFSAYSERLAQLKKDFTGQNYQVTTVLVMAPEFDALRDEMGKPKAALIAEVVKEYRASGKPGSTLEAPAPVPAPVSVVEPAPVPVAAPTPATAVPSENGDFIERVMARHKADKLAAVAAPVLAPTPTPAPMAAVAPESPKAALIRAAKAVHANRGGMGFPEFAAEADFIVTSREQIGKLLGEDAPLPSFLLADKHMARVPGMDGAIIADIAKPILPRAPKLLFDEHYSRGVSKKYALDEVQLHGIAVTANSDYGYASSPKEADTIFTCAKALQTAGQEHRDRATGPRGASFART